MKLAMTGLGWFVVACIATVAAVVVIIARELWVGGTR